MSVDAQRRVAGISHENTVDDYEAAMASAVGTRYAIASSHGRVALRNLLKAAEIEPHSEVILSPLTCKVVPLVLLSLGLKPVYADVDPGTLNLTVETVAAVLTKRTQAILFQCTYGSMAGQAEVMALAVGEELLLIEDRAHCMPVAGHPLGAKGVAAIYSNRLSKPLPASSGGLAVTNDGALAASVADINGRLPPAPGNWRIGAETLLHRGLLRPATYWWLLGMQRSLDPSYRARPVEAEIEAEVIRPASRISRYQARLGLGWLARVGALVRHRRQCCAHYERLLQHSAAPILPAAHQGEPLYYFPFLAKDKQKLLESARRSRLELVAWPGRTPIYPIGDPAILPGYGYRTGQCPVADRLASALVGLPTHFHVTAPFRRKLARLINRAQAAGAAGSEKQQ